MPKKDPEQYREYMRQYMRQRRKDAEIRAQEAQSKAAWFQRNRERLARKQREERTAAREQDLRNALSRLKGGPR